MNCLRSRPRGRPLWHAALAVLTATPAATLASGSQPAPPTEFDVKAAFLVHFARLTEWPADALRPGRPFLIAVVGRDPFKGVLDRTVRGESVRGRPIEVRRYRSVNEVREHPQIAFINTSAAELPRTLAHFDGAAVLTVSDAAGFAERGGVVGFRITPEQNVRFDISWRRTTAQGLRISSEVLKLARVVDGPQP